MLLKQKSEMQEEHILQVRQLHEDMSKLRHDSKQYSETIYTLTNNITEETELVKKAEAAEKLKKYAFEVIGDIEKIEGTKYTEITGNIAVDSILSYKVEFARKKDIDVKLSLLYQISKIADADITTLFGNMLDNAIEACVNIKNGNIPKKINISIHKKKAYAVISVENTIENSVLKTNPGFITVKEDSARHGLGMKSIKKIADKYNGLIDCREESNMFILKVMLVEN